MIRHTPEMERQTATFGQSIQECSAAEQVCHYIEENPTSAILIGLGLGFGAGLALGAMLRNSTHYFQPDESFAERLGHQVADSLASVLPKGWKNPLGS